MQLILVDPHGPWLLVQRGPVIGSAHDNDSRMEGLRSSTPHVWSAHQRWEKWTWTVHAMVLGLLDGHHRPEGAACDAAVRLMG
jgi:hypothetical protein